MKTKSKMSRRKMLGSGALGAVGTLVVGCQAEPTVLDPMSEEALIASSSLSGEPLSVERVRMQKPFFDFVTKKIKLMREFDPGDEEPSPVFRIE